MPLGAEKEESMVLRGEEGRKKRRNGLVENMKWLGVIPDEGIELAEHWRYRIGKAQSLLEALGGVGNSTWGMNLVSWSAAYTGMIRRVTSWGAEIGWRGQKESKQEMTLLPNVTLHKT